MLLHTDKTRNERVTRDETCKSLIEPLDIPTDQHMHTSQDAATQPQTAQEHGMGAHPRGWFQLETYPLFIRVFADKKWTNHGQQLTPVSITTELARFCPHFICPL